MRMEKRSVSSNTADLNAIQDRFRYFADEGDWAKFHSPKTS